MRAIYNVRIRSVMRLRSVMGSTAANPSAASGSGTRPSDTRRRGGLGFSAILGVLAALLLLALDATGLAAQQGPGASLASQSMRPYAHVFWAYALAWALVLGWVISLGRRWSRVEEDLERRSGSE